MTTPGPIIHIKGWPGTGKLTIVRELASVLGAGPPRRLSNEHGKAPSQPNGVSKTYLASLSGLWRTAAGRARRNHHAPKPRYGAEYFA